MPAGKGGRSEPGSDGVAEGPGAPGTGVATYLPIAIGVAETGLSGDGEPPARPSEAVAVIIVPGVVADGDGEAAMVGSSSSPFASTNPTIRISSAITPTVTAPKLTRRISDLQWVISP